MDTTHIIQETIEAQEFNKNLRDYLLHNFTAEGKTLTEWKRYFYITIPDDINFPIIIKLSQEIAIKYQIAARLRDEFSVQLAIQTQDRDTRYHSAYHEARAGHEAQFNKNLAADSCKSAALVAIHGLETAISHQRIIKEFWSDTCKTLTETRKLVEIMGRALAGDSYVHKDMVIKGVQ
jgi:hypothetical protein